MTFSEYALTCINKTRADLHLNRSLDWCAEFVSHVVETCRPDLTNVTSISCNDMRKLMLDSGLFFEPDDAPQINDILFIDWNRGADGDTVKPLDHVAVIVKGYGDLYVDYVDGNSTDGGGNGSDGQVKRHKNYRINVTSDYPDYYLRLKPDNKRESFHTIIDNGDMYETIAKLQSARNNLNDLINELIQKVGVKNV